MAWRSNRGGHSKAASKGWGRIKSSGTMYAHSKHAVRVLRTRDVKRRLSVRPVRGRRRP